MQNVRRSFNWIWDLRAFSLTKKVRGRSSVHYDSCRFQCLMANSMKIVNQICNAMKTLYSSFPSNSVNVTSSTKHKKCLPSSGLFILLIICLNLSLTSAQRRNSSLSLGERGRDSGGTNGTGSSRGRDRGKSGIQIGGGRDRGDKGKNATIATTQPPHFIDSGGSSGSKFASGGDTKGQERAKRAIHVGLMLPYSMFQKRDYVRAVSSVISTLQQKEAATKQKKSEFFSRYKFTTDEVKMVMITVSPSPKGERSYIRIVEHNS
jgi:hypothetical protein